MRCSRKSTTSFGSAAILLAATLAWAVPPTNAEEFVRAAIVQAVRARVGSTVDVQIESLDVRTIREVSDGVSVTPAPGSRLGRAMRFQLFETDGETARRQRIGYAEAIVRVEHTYTTVVRRVRGGATLTEADVAVAGGDVGISRLERFPPVAEVVGARTRRAVEPGEAITESALTIPPLVRSGESVVTLARIGPIQARGRAIAAQRGGLGDVIRLVNRESGRRLRGRIVARGQVEVIHEP